MDSQTSEMPALPTPYAYPTPSEVAIRKKTRGAVQENLADMQVFYEALRATAPHYTADELIDAVGGLSSDYPVASVVANHWQRLQKDHHIQTGQELVTALETSGFRIEHSLPGKSKQPNLKRALISMFQDMK